MNSLYKFVVRFTPHHLHHESDGGFTVLEILIVGAIIAVLSSMLFLNFRSAGNNITARNQTVSAILSDIRRAQSMATSSSIYTDSSNVRHTVCGYGVHYSGRNTDYGSFNPSDGTTSGNSYIIYGKLRPGAGESGNCPTIADSPGYTRDYVPGSDFIIYKAILANINMVIEAACSQGSNLSFNQADIFFEPPNPKTYVSNKATPSDKPADIMVKIKPSSNCSAPSAVIKVNTSGAIDVTSY